MGFQTSLIKRTKAEKFSALVGALAIKIARQKNDPLLEKMLRYKKAYKALKRQLIQKYQAKAVLAARQIVMSK